MPNVDAQVAELQKIFRRATGQDRRVMVLGNASGVVDVPGKVGYVYVRDQMAAGYGKTTIARMEAPIKKLNGAAVLVGIARDGALAVLGADFATMEVQGLPAPLVNSNDDTAQGYPDLRKVGILQSHIYPGSSYTVAIRKFIYLLDSVFYSYNGYEGGLDLTSYVPGTANYHCFAMLLLTPAGAIEVKTSTSQPEADPLELADLNEAYASATAGSIPIGAWRLAESGSALTNDDFIDLRQWINTSNSGAVSGKATVQTTDATATTLASVTLGEGKMITLTAVINGLRSDYTEAIGGTLQISARRATGGNVTQIGTTDVTSDEDSSGTPAITADVDTATQTVRLRVAGEGSKTFNWSTRYEYLIS